MFLSTQNCSLPSHIFRLIVVALGYLAGALGDWLDRVSHQFRFPNTPCQFLDHMSFFSQPYSVQKWSRLPGYVRGICSLLGSLRRSRSGGTTACVEVSLSIMFQYDLFPAPRLLGLAYHNQRSKAANDQTPEDGGLVARGPVDVLAGCGPEGDGRHYGMCVCGGLGGMGDAQEVRLRYGWWC